MSFVNDMASAANRELCDANSVKGDAMSIDASSLGAAAQHVFEAAMKLPDSEREKLADRLYLSIEGAESDTAFEETIARRVAEIESGTAKVVEWDELRRELQERIDAARKVQNS
jgi:putative addiction module component (TIGR02574 family)